MKDFALFNKLIKFDLQTSTQCIIRPGWQDWYIPFHITLFMLPLISCTMHHKNHVQPLKIHIQSPQLRLEGALKLPFGHQNTRSEKESRTTMETNIGVTPHLPSLSVLSLVLLNIKGLKMAFNSINPRSSPSSNGFWISLYHLSIFKGREFVCKKENPFCSNIKMME